MAIIAIVGRPNVGKSTLFNRITKSTRALVDDLPGVTRDRNYAAATWDEKSFTVVDTGGFISTDYSLFDRSIREQIFQALEEADILLFVGDGKMGLHPEDSALFDILRRTSKPLFFSVNKIDSPEQQGHITDFYALGVQDIYPISSAHGFGVGDLFSDIVELIPEPPGLDEGEEDEVSGNPRIHPRSTQCWEIHPCKPNSGRPARHCQPNARDYARCDRYALRASRAAISPHRYRRHKEKGENARKDREAKHNQGPAQH